MIKVWRVERTRQSVCRPSNEESSSCPGTVVLLPAMHLRSMRSPTPQPCTLGRWHGRLLAQTARCCGGDSKHLFQVLITHATGQKAERDRQVEIRFQGSSLPEKLPKNASSQFQVSDPPPSFSSWGSLLLLFCFL